MGSTGNGATDSMVRRIPFEFFRGIGASMGFVGLSNLMRLAE